jgi:hypothetical protein
MQQNGLAVKHVRRKEEETECFAVPPKQGCEQQGSWYWAPRTIARIGNFQFPHSSTSAAEDSLPMAQQGGMIYGAKVHM